MAIETKKTRKLIDGQQEIVIREIALAVIHNYRFEEIVKRLKKEHSINITINSVYYYSANRRKEVQTVIREVAGELVRECPISLSDFRIMKIQKIFNATDDSKIRLRCINSARAEIDEHGDKLAEALKNSGNRSYNFDFSKLPSEERKDIANQFGAYFEAISGNGDRLHIPK